MSTATRLASMSEKLQQTVGRFSVEEAAGFARKPLAMVTGEHKEGGDEEPSKPKRQRWKGFPRLQKQPNGRGT